MNIFSFETKAQLKSFIGWAVSLLCLFLLFTAAFYGAFMNSKEAVKTALGNLPPQFSAIFGVQADTIFSFGGFFQFIYTYIGLVGAIMASSIALSSFSREKRSKCVDFILTKPVGRDTVFNQKLLSCLVLIVIMNILFVAASILAYTINGQDPAKTGTLVLASLSLFFMQLVFMSVSILFAVFAPKVRSVSGVATALGFAGFILMALVSLTKEEILRYISPLQYFNPATVFDTGGYEAKYAVTAAVVVVVCIALAFYRFTKSDMPAI